MELDDNQTMKAARGISMASPLMIIFGGTLAAFGSSLTWETLSTDGTASAYSLPPRAGLQTAVLTLGVVTLICGVVRLAARSMRSPSLLAATCSLALLALVVYEISSRTAHQAAFAASYGIQDFSGFRIGTGSAIYVMVIGLAVAGLGAASDLLVFKREDRPPSSDTPPSL